jgi:predicted PurR-regulated permease PerM
MMGFMREPPMSSPLPSPAPQPSPPESPNDWGSALNVRALVLIGLTGGLLYLCYAMLVPFMAPLAWALALTVLFAPMHHAIEARVSRPNIAALLSVVIIVIAVVVPVLLLADRLIVEVASGIEMLRGAVESGAWRRPFEANPTTAGIARWVEAQIDLQGLVQGAGAWLTNAAGAMLRGSLVQLASLVLTFYLLFYFLRDRMSLRRMLRRFSPLPPDDMTRLFGDVFDTVHATVYGSLTVATVQGVLGGVIFAVLGLPAPVLWGLLMGVLGIVPVLGAFIVWLPAALFLLLDGHEIKALVLVLWGAIVVGGIDNVLYPLLVGRRLRLHTAVALMSIVGGVLLFGAPGLILGPVVFSLTRGLLDIWTRRNAEDDAA